MGLPKFEERCPTFDANSCYPATNEEPQLFSMMLGKRKFGRVASISSGGEVPLFVLLPRCEEVIAIDHSYGSLASAFTKAAMLDAMSPREIRTMLLEDNFQNAAAKMDTVRQQIPSGVSGHYRFTKDDWTQFRREWFFTSLGSMTAAKNRLERLTLVHGDVTDLSTGGDKFDLLYVSNIMEHVGRSKVAPKMADFIPLLRDGGLLLVAHASYNHPITDHFKQVKAMEGFRTTWRHTIYSKVGE